MEEDIQQIWLEEAFVCPCLLAAGCSDFQALFGLAVGCYYKCVMEGDCEIGALSRAPPSFKRFPREAESSQASLVTEELDLAERFPWLNILMRRVCLPHNSGCRV